MTIRDVALCIGCALIVWGVVSLLAFLVTDIRRK